MTATRSVTGAAAAAAALWVAAILAIAAYYVPASGVRYGHAIDWLHLLATVPSIRTREIGMVLTWWDAAFWCSLFLWSALMAGPPSRARRWLAAFTPLVLLCPVNLLGGAAAVYDWVLGPSDGEVLAEHWPVLHVYAAWTLLAAAAPFLISHFHTRRGRVADQLSPTSAKVPHNNRMQLSKREGGPASRAIVGVALRS